MKARMFNGFFMPVLNQEWVGKILGLGKNGRGPDLIGDTCFAEVKFRLLHKLDDGRRYPNDWKVQEHQVTYQKRYTDKTPYWALGQYQLDREISSIKMYEVPRLETFVKERELWVVSWEWMEQFPPHRTTGRTRYSEWDITLRYPKQKLLPRTIETYSVKKGLIHLTEGVNPKDFPGLH